MLVTNLQIFPNKSCLAKQLTFTGEYQKSKKGLLQEKKGKKSNGLQAKKIEKEREVRKFILQIETAIDQLFEPGEM